MDTALTVFLAKDRSFSAAERVAFEEAVAAIRDSVASLTDQAIAVRLAEAVALSKNAHTRAYLLRNRSHFRRYPIRVWWFSDGLYVVAAKPPYDALLGHRIVEVAGHPVEELRERAKSLYPGNGAWSRYMSTYTLTSPDVLIGLGLMNEEGKAEFVFESPGVLQIRAALGPIPSEPAEKRTESWWALSPLHPEVEKGWARALAGDTATLPLYLRNPARNYWFEYLPGDSLLYFQFNRAAEVEEEPFETFQDRMLEAITVREPRRVIVDIRFNTGGNLFMAYTLFRKLAALPLAQERGRLFVITGRSTFSAGVFHAAHLKASTEAVIVGEPVGDALDFWAEGGNVVLSNSGLTLHYADRFHAYSTETYPEFAPHLFIDMSIPDLRPDVLVDASVAEFLAGRDPALEAARSYPGRE